MFSRSEMRHACYRAKNGAVTEKNQEILDLISPKLNDTQRWSNFAEVWDLIVTRNNEIKIVYPEKDYDYIHYVLTRASLFSELNKPLDDMNDREYSLVQQVEQLMLDGVMSWDNYNKSWGVVVDPSTNSIKTKMYDVSSNQIEVTPEMIEASKRDADGSAFSEPETKSSVLEMKPMDDAQSKAFEEFLAKKYKG